MGICKSGFMHQVGHSKTSISERYKKSNNGEHPFVLCVKMVSGISGILQHVNTSSEKYKKVKNDEHPLVVSAKVVSITRWDTPNVSIPLVLAVFLLIREVQKS